MSAILNHPEYNRRPEPLNDAVLWGVTDAPDLHRDMTIAVASWRRAVNWRTDVMSVATFLNRLTFHVNRHEKDKSLVFMGKLAGLRRKAEDVQYLDALAFDFDHAPPRISFDETEPTSLFGVALDAVRAAGLTAAIFTTHSSTARHEKIRVILPLAAPWIVDPKKPLHVRKEEWSVRYRAVADGLKFSPWDREKDGPEVPGTLAYDPTGDDLNRAFYSPAHKPGESFRVAINLGECLTLPDLPPIVTKRRKTKSALSKAGVGAFERAARGADSPLVRRFGRVLAHDADYFDVAGFVEALGWPIVSWSGPDKAVIRCPNAAEHSNQNENDGGCVALSPNNDQEFAAIRCRHAHCQHLTTKEMLAMICEQIEIVEDPISLAESFVGDES